MQAELEKLAAAELRRAATLFGETNHSDHESYAVLKEEIEKALEQTDQLKPELERFWAYVKQNPAKLPPEYQTTRKDMMRGILYNLRCRAINGAKELLQTVAMCDKAINTMDAPKEDSDGY